MTEHEKKELINQSVKLCTFGATVEICRNKLRKLVDKKMSYESPQMKVALAESEWKRLELEHLAYRTRTDALNGNIFCVL